MPRLSQRLMAIAALVVPGRPMADIGTDHGYLPAYLVLHGSCPSAIASDRLPGPLAAARATVEEAGLTGRIELRLGEGLSVLSPGEVETVVVAGMGGGLIAAILAAADPAVLHAVGRLVLQPMNNAEAVRRWLTEHGWGIAAEELVADTGRLYVVIAAEPAAQAALSELDYIVGPLLRKKSGPLLDAYLKKLLTPLRSALAGCAHSTRPEARRRAAELRQRIAMIESLRDQRAASEVDNRE